MNLLQRRAWECAHVLAEDFPECLAVDDFILCAAADIAGPERVTANHAFRLLAIWHMTMERRR